MLREMKWYSLIGVANTLLHTAVFAMLVSMNMASAWANFIAFIVVATFSFFANARFTFKRVASKKRYALFMVIMGTLALATGWLTDFFRLPEILAVVFLLAISWILGFLSAKKIVFR